MNPKSALGQAKACGEAWGKGTIPIEHADRWLPAFKDWKDAQEKGLSLPEAPPLLHPWKPPNVPSGLLPLQDISLGHAILVRNQEISPCDAHALNRAAVFSGIQNHFFTGNNFFEGYPWYDALDTITLIQPKLVHESRDPRAQEEPMDPWRRLRSGTEPPEKALPLAPKVSKGPWRTLPQRPERIFLRLSLMNGKGRRSVADLPSDFAFDHGGFETEFDKCLPVATKDAALTVDELVEILDRSFRPTSSQSLKYSRIHLASRVLESDQAAARRTVQAVAQKELPKLLPPGKGLRIQLVDLADESEPAIALEEPSP